MAVTFDEDALDLNTVFQHTYQVYKNRFDYRDRDVLKTVKVQEIREYVQDRLNQPEVRYKITTSSYPQYKPYTDVKGKRSKKQRKIKHQYDLVLVLENMTMDARFRYREGSQRKWPKYESAPWTKIKQLNSSVREKLQKKHGKNTEAYKKAVQKHKKQAKYLDFGDWVSKSKGINGDFYWRQAPRASRTGNLYGMYWPEPGMDHEGIPFFGKHSLRVIMYLLKSGKLNY